jgi:hypothetical protein
MIQYNEAMVNVTIPAEWFHSVKSYVKYANDYHYIREGKEMVEVDVEADAFTKESIALGWM